MTYTFELEERLNRYNVFLKSFPHSTVLIIRSNGKQIVNASYNDVYNWCEEKFGIIEKFNPAALPTNLRWYARESFAGIDGMFIYFSDEADLLIFALKWL